MSLITPRACLALGCLAAACGFDSSSNGGSAIDAAPGSSDAAVTAGSDGAPADDAASDPDAGESAIDCATACAGIGTCEGDTCAIDCNGDEACDQRVDCPAGVPCRVRCSTDGACAGGVRCGDATNCTVECSANDTCGGLIECSDGTPCRVTCSGQNTCVDGVTCDLSCACSVDCSGPSSCDTQASCPDGCDSGKGCTPSGAGCDTCSP